MDVIAALQAEATKLKKQLDIGLRAMHLSPRCCFRNFFAWFFAIVYASSGVIRCS
jgi:hypothetical protein